MEFFVPAIAIVAVVAATIYLSRMGSKRDDAYDNGGARSGDSFVATSFIVSPVRFTGFNGLFAPIILQDGRELRMIADINDMASSVRIAGFDSDPGASYLSSVSCNGVTLQALAASYAYIDGSASWSWPMGKKFGFVSGSEYRFSFVYGGK